MKIIALLLSGFAAFALGAWVGAPFVQDPKAEAAKNKNQVPRVDSSGLLNLRDALQRAEQKLATFDPLHDRAIGALWKANENGAEYIYADICPPYLAEGLPANDTLRLAIRIDHHGAAKWAWIQGTVLLTPQTPSKGKRRTVLYPEGHLGPSTTIDHEGRVLSRQGPESP
jgi:hypothetical protein